MARPDSPTAARDPGLCATCRHGRRVESDRGSVFYLCEKSKVDPRFPKYPFLPVTQCPAHEPAWPCM